MHEDEVYVCRCEEITLGEIKRAIIEGARDVTGVKRRTRAGMGLCQGRSCGRFVEEILCRQLGKRPEEIGPATKRPPVRPITFGALSEAENEDR
jgi:NAD(P)H-nitrite reductase large subunit